MNERVEELRKKSKEEIGGRLKSYRKDYGYTQEALAERLGVPRNTLFRWESGGVKISPVMLRMLVGEGIL